ncbi:MAG: thiol-disulfide oxidoreductase DCC family protein [Cytophagaceae bacterium]|nr:thiol-disulfide oxidoreductase DCC family protein [Cytophagaceae bacterium]
MSQPPNKPVILFDGVCNFCNSSVNFVIDRDKNKKFLFAALQSEAGKKLLKEYNIPFKEIPDSVVLIQDNKAYQKSSAALKIAWGLGGLWSMLYAFIIIPSFIRDFFYELIAKYRYKLFGKKESCRMPDPEIRTRFLG